MHELNLKLETFTVVGETKKMSLTRRKLFYKGFFGKLKCLFFWLAFRDETKEKNFKQWLDEPLAYSIENPNAHFGVNCDKQIEIALEHYLTDQVPNIKN